MADKDSQAIKDVRQKVFMERLEEICEIYTGHELNIEQVREADRPTLTKALQTVCELLKIAIVI